MAKVYSWAISNTQYAYIADPDNTNDVYIGRELTGKKLETVINWAQTCSKEEYIAHFNIIRESVKNVEFESVEAYMNVPSTCDNLRGPAGRGIESITFVGNNQQDNSTIYRINYDDGTYDGFVVYNGTNGRDGKDGKDGAKGDVGVSTRLVMVYTSGKDAEGNLITPERPRGGNYNFATGEIEYPVGWEPNDSGIAPPVWKSERTFATEDVVADKEWSVPVQITGENGAPGADGVSTEFIYKLTDVEPTQDEIANLESKNESGYVPEGWGWTGSPKGVTEDDKIEWTCIRKKGVDGWGPWTGPTIWSKYGVNGQDGDGVQYIYCVNNGTTPDNPTPLDWETNEDYQNKDTEWIPKEGSSYINVNGVEIEISGNSVWTDDPQDVSIDNMYAWAACRKYRKNADGKHMWQKFSNPTLWSKYGESGSNGTSVRTLYKLTDSTGNAPDLPPGPTDYGEWGTGFPVDYDYGKNVVWGTSAVVWAHNNEFVNPAEGWCKPFLVTGVKGEDGVPIDYNTTYFAYGWVESTPKAPITGGTVEYPGESEDELGNKIQWRTFPDTSIGVDNDTNRWYQCTASIDGKNGVIKKWGPVLPNSGKDGKGYPGNYLEFRLAVSQDEFPPDLHIYDNDGNVVREPEFYGEDGELRGWFTTSEELPELEYGGSVWQIWGLIDGETDEVLPGNSGVYWNGPLRISGERGIEGPAGLRGVTGIPGATFNTMYCLGTEGRGEKGESFQESGDGYFGSTVWRDGVLMKDMTGWYKEPPYSDVIETTTQEELSAALNESKNVGRVVRFLEVTTGVTNGTTKYVEKYQTYYLVLDGKGNTQIIKERHLVPKDDDEDLKVYLWCIQGVDKYETSDVDFYAPLSTKPKDATSNNTLEVTVIPNEQNTQYKYLYMESTDTYYQWQGIDGDKVEHTLTRIEWKDPFRLQGVNGLRGLAGNRGQVVYPMGVYNEEEVYITTANKAPYVYDPSDGLFYVLNMVDDPWVGKLPDNYKTIMSHPEDATKTNTKEVDYDPSGDKAEISGFKYLKYNGNYYAWSDSGYYMASKYKYSIGGSGDLWMTDQQGDLPSLNYANNTNENRDPAWVRFESFQALYTSIGIIANGMIGSAVYNNEFMFSQQGRDINDNPSQDYQDFLNGYKYNEREKQWEYKGTGIKINDEDVNPYEKKDGKYIHSFRPNVCINFKTGEMWTSAGKVNFDASGAGYLANQYINWTSGGTVVIGKPEDDANGIVINNEGMTIGPLNSYMLTTDGLIEDINASIQRAVNRINGIGADGYVTPEEQKNLKNEKATIEKEYSSFIEQCNSYGLTATTHTYYDKYDSYKKWYNRAISALTYYTNSENYASTNSGDTYYNCIKIESGYTGTGTTGQYYGNIAQYYSSRQELQNALTCTAENRATTSAITSANTYTRQQISGVTETISNLEGTIQGQMDKKADTWAVDYDPSSAWTSTDICNEHIGDIWYAKSSGYTYTFNNKNTNSNTGCSVKAATTAGTYYWVRSDVSLLAFDYADGSSSIHYGVNPTGYTKNDMWCIPTGQEALPTDCKVKDTVICTKDPTNYTENSAGVKIATAYTASDWAKLDRYTDDTYAENKFNDWAADKKLSPPERKALKDEANAIAAESASTYNQCVKYFGTGDTRTTNYTNAAKYAYNTAMYYATGVTSDITAVVPISGETSTGNYKTYYGNIKNYYKVRQETQDAIVNAAQEKAASSGSSAASAAQTAAQNALAKQIGYSSYDDMVETVKSNGKIVTTGGKLNADMIEATWVNAVIVSAQTATVKSLTADTAWVGDLTVQKLNTTPSANTTKGRILIEGNDIKVFENSNRNDREVLRITGDKLIELPSPIDKTGTIANVTIFSSGRLTASTTISGVCNATLCSFTTPSEKGFSYTIKSGGKGQLYYSYPPTSTNNSSVDGKVIYALYNGNSRIGTISSGSTGGSSSGSTISGYNTMSSSALTGLTPNTSYNVKAEYNVSNNGGQDIGSCYISGTTNESFTISPECNKLDVASDGIRYALSNESYFECKYDSENRIEIIMQATPSNYIKVTKSNIYMGINNKSYHGVSSGNQLTFIE